jgi:tight adherence protein B
MLSSIGLSVLVFGSVVLLVVAVPAAVRLLTHDRLRKRHAATERVLQDMFVTQFSARDIAIMTVLAACVLGVALYLLSGSVLVGCFGGAIVLGLPRPVLAHLRAQRVARIEEQLPGAIDLLTSYTRSGLSLTQALEELAGNTDAPISEELSLIVQDVRVGSDVGRAIDAARQRLGSRTFGLVATALQVSREKGGNLTEALERMSGSLKEIWRLEQKLITASSEARKATWIISGAPIGIAVMVMVMQPDLAYGLVESFLGMVFLVLAVGVYAFGLWWLLKSMKVVV